MFYFFFVTRRRRPPQPRRTLLSAETRWRDGDGGPPCAVTDCLPVGSSVPVNRAKWCVGPACWVGCSPGMDSKERATKRCGTKAACISKHFRHHYCVSLFSICVFAPTNPVSCLPGYESVNWAVKTNGADRHANLPGLRRAFRCCGTPGSPLPHDWIKIKYQYKYFDATTLQRCRAPSFCRVSTERALAAELLLERDAPLHVGHLP